MGRNEEEESDRVTSTALGTRAPAQVLPATQGTRDSCLPSSEVPGHSFPHPQPRLEPIRSKENNRHVPGLLNPEGKHQRSTGALLPPDWAEGHRRTEVPRSSSRSRHWLGPSSRSMPHKTPNHHLSAWKKQPPLSLRCPAGI